MEASQLGMKLDNALCMRNVAPPYLCPYPPTPATFARGTPSHHHKQPRRSNTGRVCSWSVLQCVFISRVEVVVIR